MPKDRPFLTSDQIPECQGGLLEIGKISAATDRPWDPLCKEPTSHIGNIPVILDARLLLHRNKEETSELESEEMNRRINAGVRRLLGAART